MTYDFDTIITRRGTHCSKWDKHDDPEILPMWVADMDFRTAPAIIEALRRRVDHGVFGYTKVPGAYYQAIHDWFLGRHGWDINPNHVIYTTGVVPAVSAVIKALTIPGDKVILQTPAYNCFYPAIRNNGCEASANVLLYNEADGTYSIDYDDLERRAADPRATVLLLCNPHNPSGRVWTRDELLRIFDICQRHGVVVISDEIHCEFTYQGQKYVPFATVSAEAAAQSVFCCSPSKAFNIAGLQIANIVAPDPQKRAAIDRAININEVCDVSPFGVAGLMAAYNESGPWLDALCDYLWENYLTVKDFFERNLPKYKVTPLQGTYLVWINCKATGLTTDQLEHQLLHEGKIKVSMGAIYGEGGDGFIRLNIACPRAMLRDGLNRLHSVLAKY